MAQLHLIRQHGNPQHYHGHFPRYLLKCLQQWLRYNQHQLYNHLKHLSYSFAQIDTLIQNIPMHNHTAILAQAHQILERNYRKKLAQPPSNQMTLGF